jgi:serine phosphatase RsbU (regulator of sigma subunit)
MTETTGFIVKWYRSLQFRLFVLMSIFLLITIAAISFQNGSSLWNILARTSEDSTRYAARRGAASLSNLIDQWQASLHTTMHTLSLDPKRFPNHAQALLNSSRDLLALNVFRIAGDKPPKLMHSVFSPYQDASNFGEVDAKELRKSLLQADSAHANESNSSAEVQIRALNQTLGVAALQIQVPFPVEGSKETLIATLSVWAAKLEGLLESRPDFEALILDEQGNVFLAHNKSTWKPSPQTYDRLIRNLSGTGATSSLHTEIDAEGVPQVEVASYVPSTPLIYYVQKNAVKDFSDMLSQTRKVAFFSLGLLLIAVLASYLAAGTLSRKIKQTVRATEQIANGNLEVVIQNNAADEVGVLSRSVNHMALRIRQLLEVEVEAARQEKELKTAQMVQQTFFRAPNTENQAFRVTGHFEPASECAGDWWIHIPYSEAGCLVVIADATGHGASAALIVAMAYSYFQTSLHHAQRNRAAIPTPSELLMGFNHILIASGRGKTTMTMLVADLDANSQVLRFANAGHLSPLLIPASTEDDRLRKGSTNPAKSRVNPILGSDVMLGFEPGAHFEDRTYHLRSGDRILLYTDGLIECRGTDGTSLTPMGLRRAVADWADQPEADLCQSVLNHTYGRLGNTPREDDFTVVVIELVPAMNNQAQSERRVRHA